MSWRFVLALIFAVVVSFFAIQNSAIVAVKFMTWNVEISQALVILLSAIIGAIMIMLFDVIRWIKTQTKISGQSKTISRLEKENEQLKAKLDESSNKLSDLNQQVETLKQQITQPDVSTLDQSKSHF